MKATICHIQAKVVVSDPIFPWWLSQCKKSKTSIDSFPKYWWSNNATILLVESYNCRITFFPDIWFSQNHTKHCYAPFLGLKKIHQWIRCLTKAKIHFLGEFFWAFFQFLIFFRIFSEKSGTVGYWPSTPSKFMKNIPKSYKSFLKKTDN